MQIRIARIVVASDQSWMVFYLLSEGLYSLFTRGSLERPY